MSARAERRSWSAGSRPVRRSRGRWRRPADVRASEEAERLKTEISALGFDEAA